MSRYKLRFVPQGAMPVDMNMGIHMTPQVDPGGVDPVVPVDPCPPVECVPTCGVGWGVTINDAPSTGDVHHFLDAAFEAVVVALDDEVELCGGCVEWELRQLSIESEELQLADISVEANGCNGATVTGAGDVSYEGLWFGLYPTLDGLPFCQPILFRSFTDCTTIIGPGATNTWFEIETDGALPYGPAFNLAGEVTSGAAGAGPPRIRITGIQICAGDTVDWAIVQDAGTLGNGEGISILTPLPSGVWTLTFATLFDLTDSVFTVTPIVNGIPYTEQNITFTCDNT